MKKIITSISVLLISSGFASQQNPIRINNPYQMQALAPANLQTNPFLQEFHLMQRDYANFKQYVLSVFNGQRNEIATLQGIIAQQAEQINRLERRQSETLNEKLQEVELACRKFITEDMQTLLDHTSNSIFTKIAGTIYEVEEQIKVLKQSSDTFKESLFDTQNQLKLINVKVEEADFITLKKELIAIKQQLTNSQKQNKEANKDIYEKIKKLKELYDSKLSSLCKKEELTTQLNKLSEELLLIKKKLNKQSKNIGLQTIEPETLVPPVPPKEMPIFVSQLVQTDSVIDDKQTQSQSSAENIDDNQSLTDSPQTEVKEETPLVEDQLHEEVQTALPIQAENHTVQETLHIPLEDIEGITQSVLARLSQVNSDHKNITIHVKNGSFTITKYETEQNDVNSIIDNLQAHPVVNKMMSFIPIDLQEYRMFVQLIHRQCISYCVQYKEEEPEQNKLILDAIHFLCKEDSRINKYYIHKSFQFIKVLANYIERNVNPIKQNLVNVLKEVLETNMGAAKIMEKDQIYICKFLRLITDHDKSILKIIQVLASKEDVNFFRAYFVNLLSFYKLYPLSDEMYFSINYIVQICQLKSLLLIYIKEEKVENQQKINLLSDFMKDIEDTTLLKLFDCLTNQAEDFSVNDKYCIDVLVACINSSPAINQQKYYTFFTDIFKQKDAHINRLKELRSHLLKEELHLFYKRKSQLDRFKGETHRLIKERESKTA